MLQLPADWVYGNPGSLPASCVEDFFVLIKTVARQGNNWALLEHFKSTFGAIGRSSDPSWALTDLRMLSVVRTFGTTRGVDQRSMGLVSD